MMLRWGLFMLALTFLVAESGWADGVYRCRDAAGQLIMTDDPGKFPPGCKPIEEAPESRGALIVVPTPQEPVFAPSNAEAAAARERAARADRQAQIDDFKQEARALAAAYKSAEVRRNQAYRRWSYSSREVVTQAQEQMEDARQGKEQLLRAMDRVFVPAPEREEIHSILEVIP